MCSGVDSASKNEYQGVSPGIKMAGAWSWQSTTLVVPNDKYSGALTYPDRLGHLEGLLWVTFTFLQYIVLFFIILCIVLYCSLLYSVLYYTVLYCILSPSPLFSVSRDRLVLGLLYLEDSSVNISTVFLTFWLSYWWMNIHLRNIRLFHLQFISKTF
jgi:hypothetical protein